MLIINLAQRKNREPDCNLVPLLYTLGKKRETADWNKLNSLSQAKLMWNFPNLHDTVSCFVYRNIPNKGAGAIARSCLIVLDQCWGSKLSNGGFGLKIGQILGKLWRFRPFFHSFWLSQTMGGTFIRGAPLIGILRYTTVDPLSRVKTKHLGDFLMRV